MKKILLILLIVLMLLSLAVCGRQTSNRENISNNETQQAISYTPDLNSSLSIDETSQSVEEPKVPEESVVDNSSVNPDIKLFLDEYEAFMDEYIDFMEKYQNSDNTMEMLADYSDIMQRYADFTKSIAQYDSDKMSAADTAYYLEVTSRINKKLLDVAN